MESSAKLETIIMGVKIERLPENGETEIVNFVVSELDNMKVNLSESDVNDLKHLFDKIFEYIISKRKLIEFQLVDEKSDLFFEVASDLVEHLNHEIIQSKDNFESLIELEKSVD